MYLYYEYVYYPVYSVHVPEGWGCELCTVFTFHVPVGCVFCLVFMSLYDENVYCVQCSCTCMLSMCTVYSVHVSVWWGCVLYSVFIYLYDDVYCVLCTCTWMMRMCTILCTVYSLLVGWCSAFMISISPSTSHCTLCINIQHQNIKKWQTKSWAFTSYYQVQETCKTVPKGTFHSFTIIVRK